jgi:hypothetical protein
MMILIRRKLMIRMSFGMIRSRTVTRKVRVAWQDQLSGEWRGTLKEVQQSVPKEIWVGDQWIDVEVFEQNRTMYVNKYLRMIGRR